MMRALPAFFLLVSAVLAPAGTRPPAAFDHDLHTAALEQEGCVRCHPQDSAGKIIFVFPGDRGEKSGAALRDANHDACIGCHKQKKNGKAPLLCGECHYAHAEPARPAPVFDYAIHDRHMKAMDNDCGQCHTLPPGSRRDFAGRHAAHGKCIKCHLEIAGPADCKGCHAFAPALAQDVAAAARPAAGQKERLLLSLARDSMVKAVPFNHKAHESNGTFCADCHHAGTLQACSDCHAHDAAKGHSGVSLFDAFHRLSSEKSCAGCHGRQKKKQECAGCHALRGGMDHSTCKACHSGSLASLDAKHGLRLIEKPDTLLISMMEDKYGPARMPHRSILRNLAGVSAKSPLASFFHADSMTLCEGCHHYASFSRDASPRSCRVCHAQTPKRGATATALLGAYHQQCLGCHERMDPSGKKLPASCEGCHAAR